MTSELVQGFFPETSSLVRTNFPWIWNSIFPEELAERCPTPYVHYKLSSGEVRVLRWPILLIWGCVPGIVIGMILGMELLVRALLTRGQTRGLFCWAHVLLWYAVMNVGGLVFHCLNPDPVFAGLDILGTSASSISIILAVLTHLGHINDQRQLSRALIWLLYVGLGLVLYLGPPLLDEQMYLLPVLWAGVAVLCLIADTFRQTPVTCSPSHAAQARWWLLGASLSGAAGFGTVLVDPLLCRHLGAHFLVVVWAFYGCNMAMLCLYRFAKIVWSSVASSKAMKTS